MIERLSRTPIRVTCHTDVLEQSINDLYVADEPAPMPTAPRKPLNDGLGPEWASPLIAFGIAGVAFSAATLILMKYVDGPSHLVCALSVGVNGFAGAMSLLMGLGLRHESQ